MVPLTGPQQVDGAVPSMPKNRWPTRPPGQDHPAMVGDITSVRKGEINPHYLHCRLSFTQSFPEPWRMPIHVPSALTTTISSCWSPLRSATKN